jgi:TetR/AcrR family transcriptional regulator, cholesterol catabolism regulator
VPGLVRPAYPADEDGVADVAARKAQPALSAGSQVASRIKDEAVLAAGRERLLKGARKCFAKKGYGGTSVQDIADAAGLSIGSVYKYVRAKEDLLRLMAESSHRSLARLVDEAFSGADDPLRALPGTVSALIRNADGDRDLMSLLYAEFKYMPAASKAMVREQEQAILSRLVTLIEAGNRSGVFSCPHPEITALDIAMFGSTWVLKNYSIKVPIDEYIAQQTESALRLVGAKAD